MILKKMIHIVPTMGQSEQGLSSPSTVTIAYMISRAVRSTLNSGYGYRANGAI